MKHLLLTTIAAVLLAGCGEAQQSATTPEATPVGPIEPVAPVTETAKPEPPTAKAPDISIIDAARDGNIKSVKQHLAAGTHVDTINSFENTALHRAAEFGRKEVVELLIAKGADVNARGFLGITSLDRAIDNDKTEVADILRKHGGKTGRELKAEGKPTEPVAEASQPEPPTAKAPDKRISIHVAAARGNIEVVKQHIAAGRDANAKDDYKQTPLHMAALHGEEEVAELLIAEGANVNAQRDGGGTPLDLAYTRPETADLLRKHGGKTRQVFKAEGK